MLRMVYEAVVLTVVLIAACFSLASRDAFCAAMEEMHHFGGHEHMGNAMKAPEVIVDLETRPAELRTGMPTTITFFIKDAGGNPLQDLTVTHERLVHVMIISADFRTFAHIHPDDLGPITSDMIKDARFPIRYVFPTAGRYLIALDSAVNDEPFSEHFTVDVGGEPRMGTFKRDLSRGKMFGDYEVMLASSPERITVGKEVVLKYTISREGRPVTDLEPYLSAPMHVAIVEDDLNNFIHTHGELPDMPHHPMMAGHMHMEVPANFGPEIDIYINFPSKGFYQIFGELKHQGRVVLTSFMIQVE
ncbi:MAG TPA: hypothetical protein VEE82_03060 [Thermodesulfovibrionales bacterium]|nr:hypothetical protein [Thermodesulfovibrionales bacterium]